MAVQTDLVSLLVDLADALRAADAGSLTGPPARVNAFLACSLQRVMRTYDPATDDSRALGMLQGAITACSDPAAAATDWAGVLCSSAEWTRVAGKTTKFHLPIAKMRRCTGFLTSEVSQPVSRSGSHPQGLRVAFDEGAELTTITKAAWLKHQADWKKGHPPFTDDPEIGPPHGIALQHPVTLTGFHGDETPYHNMVFIHLRLGCACYPLRCMLVDHAPADIVLGLGFRRMHNAAWPEGYPPSQTMGVTTLCLGVPPGYGIYFPKALRRRYQGRDPAATGFRQVLRLDTEWYSWPATGKRLTPEQAVDAVANPTL